MVSSTPRPNFTPGKDPVRFVQEAPGPVWTGGKSRPHRDSIPDRPAPSQSLYRLSYPAHGYSRYYSQYKSALTSICKLRIDTSRRVCKNYMYKDKNLICHAGLQYEAESAQVLGKPSAVSNGRCSRTSGLFKLQTTKSTEGPV